MTYDDAQSACYCETHALGYEGADHAGAYEHGPPVELQRLTSYRVHHGYVQHAKQELKISN